MLHVDNPVGRLIAMRGVSPIRLNEVMAFGNELMELLSTIEGQIVALVDLRLATVVSPDVSDAFSAMLRHDNPRLERSGFLLGMEAATLRLQVERMLREAGNPRRRSFLDPDGLKQWLAEVLSDEECTALDSFLQNTLEHQT